MRPVSLADKVFKELKLGLEILLSSNPIAQHRVLADT